MTLRPGFWLVLRILPLFIFLGLEPAPTATAQSWPMRAGDAQRTAYQAMGANIQRPVVQYRVDLGGGVGGRQWFAGDANLDGDLDVAVMRAGRVLLRSGSGRILWASAARDLEGVEAIADLDGDGVPEVWARGGEAGLVALDGFSGEAIFSVVPEEGRAFGSAIVTDVEGDGRPELYVAECPRGSAFTGAGWIYKFERGFDSATRVELDLSLHGRYWRCNDQAMVDLDGDSILEVATLAHDRVVVYSALTGLPLWETRALPPFPFARGVIRARDIDGDGRDELVVLSNNATASFEEPKRLMIVEYVASDLRVRGSYVFRGEGVIHDFAGESFLSLDRGESTGVVTSAYDPASDLWSTLVFSGDATTLESPVVSLPGTRLLGFSQVESDGGQSIYVVATEGVSSPTYGEIRSLRITSAGEVETQWVQSAARLIFERVAWGSSRPVFVDGESGAEPILLIDLDGDLRGESFRLGGTSVERRCPERVYGAAARRLPSGFGAGALLSLTDGRIEVVDASLSLGNDSSPEDGVADLRESAYFANQATVSVEPGHPTVLITAADGALSAYWGDMPTESGGLALGWQSALQVESRDVPIFLPDAAHSVVYRSRRADGSLLLIRLDPETGTEVAGWEIGAEAELLAYHDLTPLARVGGDSWVAYGLRDRRSNVVSYLRFDPNTGTSVALEIGRDVTGSGDRPASAFDYDGDEVDDLFVMQRRVLSAASGSTGRRILSQATADNGGMLLFADLDGSGNTSVLQHNTRRPRALEITGFTPLWDEETNAGGYTEAAIAPLDGGGFAVAHSPIGSGELRIRDGRDGSLIAAPTLAGGGLFASAEAARASGVEPVGLVGLAGVSSLFEESGAGFVVSANDGYLYAVDIAGSLLWSLSVRGTPRAPVLADLQNDGDSEVLLSLANGTLAIISEAGLPAPELVIDTDGSGSASSDSVDIDEAASTTALGGAWEGVDAADGYEYRLLREDDLVVVDYTDVGMETTFSRSDLSLELGRSYRLAVRSYRFTERERLVSTDTLSDGFVVTDDAPPSVSLEARPGLIWRDRPGTVSNSALIATLTDTVGLASFRLTVHDQAGEEVRVVADSPIGGTRQTIEQVWDGNGDGGTELPGGVYEARALVTDRTGLTARASAAVVLCADDFVEADICRDAMGSVVTLVAEPEVFAPFPGSVAPFTDLILDVADATVLTRYVLEVLSPTGDTVITLADSPLAGDTSTIRTRWAGTTPSGVIVAPGEYLARARVVNDVGLSAEATARVIVCGVEEESPVECADVLAPWQVRGGGCQCATVGPHGDAPGLWWMALLAGVAFLGRRRTRSPRDRSAE